LWAAPSIISNTVGGDWFSHYVGQQMPFAGIGNMEYVGIQAAYYYNTLFGPVGATLGYSNRTKEPYVYVNLGYEF
jgi:NTE family protein